jgi:uncharacterized protein GlcG (DUF336 family)
MLDSAHDKAYTAVSFKNDKLALAERVKGEASIASGAAVMTVARGRSYAGSAILTMATLFHSAGHPFS